MSYQFYLPTEIKSGKNETKNLPHFLMKMGIKNPIILSDKGIKATGIIDSILKRLTENKIKCVEFYDIEPNPKDKNIKEITQYAKSNEVDGIIAVGGGSVLDTAKGVGIMLTHEGEINDWEGDNTLKKDISPLICIPTTCGTGSEATNIAVITDTERKLKMGIVDDRIAPKLAILDPELINSLPPGLTASTGMDALTHAIEAYTSKAATPVTDALALHAITLIRENIYSAVQDDANNEAKANMLNASLLAGIAFSNSNVGSVHCISEAMGGVYDIPHGIVNAIFLPYVFEYNSEEKTERHATISYALGVDRNLSPKLAIQQGVNLLFEMVKNLDIPKLHDFKQVNSNDFNHIAQLSKSTPMDLDNAKEMTEEDYLSIIQRAFRGS